MKKLIQGGLIVLSALILSSCLPVLTPDQAKTKAQDFINQTLVTPGEPVTITDIIEEAGVYKLTVKFLNGETTFSFMTKDGKKFFPNAYEIKEAGASAETGAGADVAATQTVKADKPSVELFVMSHCPHGTQIEKGILPVLDVLADSIDFQLKFCDYAMHDKKELDEQLNQYCIQKNEPEKLLTYLTCFLEAGDGANCLQKTGINLVTLNQCVKTTDQDYKVTEKYNDQSTWVSGRYPQFNVFKTDNDKYSVQGSPTLIINGAEASTDRSPDALLKAICSSFNTPPAVCSTQLATTTPSSGFGFSGTGTDGSAQCE